jgi:hypothetical protein
MRNTFRFLWISAVLFKKYTKVNSEVVKTVLAIIEVGKISLKRLFGKNALSMMMLKTSNCVLDLHFKGTLSRVFFTSTCYMKIDPIWNPDAYPYLFSNSASNSRRHLKSTVSASVVSETALRRKK